MLSYGYAPNALSSMNGFPLVLGYVIGTIGWLAGLGVFNDLIRQMVGKPVPVAEEDMDAATGLARSSGSPWTTRSSASSTWSG